MKFENGWTASIQFGPGNYCQYKMADFDLRDQLGRAGSEDAEIAAWPESGELASFGPDTVCGFVQADEVAKFLHFVSMLPADPAGQDLPTLWEQMRQQNEPKKALLTITTE